MPDTDTAKCVRCEIRPIDDGWHCSECKREVIGYALEDSVRNPDGTHSVRVQLKFEQPPPNTDADWRRFWRVPPADEPCVGSQADAPPPGPCDDRRVVNGREYLCILEHGHFGPHGGMVVVQPFEPLPKDVKPAKRWRWCKSCGKRFAAFYDFDACAACQGISC